MKLYGLSFFPTVDVVSEVKICLEEPERSVLSPFHHGERGSRKDFQLHGQFPELVESLPTGDNRRRNEVTSGYASQKRKFSSLLISNRWWHWWPHQSGGHFHLPLSTAFQHSPPHWIQIPFDCWTFRIFFSLRFLRIAKGKNTVSLIGKHRREQKRGWKCFFAERLCTGKQKNVFSSHKRRHGNESWMESVERDRSERKMGETRIIDIFH